MRLRNVSRLAARLTGALACALIATTALAGDYLATGPYSVEVIRQELRDPARDRTVPVTIYLPKNAPAPAPVILFSHGLGGNREAAAYLGLHLAGHGYVCVHMQHPGSDESVWRGQPRPYEQLRRSIAVPANAVGRYGDPGFVLDALARLNSTDARLRGRLDLSRVGMCGHSYGAKSVLVAAGERQAVAGARFAEPRIKAFAALSPSPNAHMDASTYSAMLGPIFHITGTKDESPITPDVTPIRRRIPFDAIANVDEYLVVVDGGRHADFAKPETTAATAHAHDLVKAGLTAFFDSRLRGDISAKDWLEGAGFRALLAKGDTLEIKKSAKQAGVRPARPAGRW